MVEVTQMDDAELDSLAAVVATKKARRAKIKKAKDDEMAGVKAKAAADQFASVVCDIFRKDHGKARR